MAGKRRDFEEIKSQWLKNLNNGHMERGGRALAKACYNRDEDELRSLSRGKKRRADLNGEDEPQMMKRQWNCRGASLQHVVKP